MVCRKLVLIILIGWTAVQTHAQSDPEYMMEIGGGIGLMGYLGDFNGTPTRDLQPMGTAVLRRIFTPYQALRLSASAGKIKGASNDVETYYPDMASLPYTFNNTLVDLSLTYEYNFWPYGTGRDYRGARRLVPFVFMGLGGTFVKGQDENELTANVPMGLGVKYKIGDRLNLGVEWGIHFSMSDLLDGRKDPYHVESSGMFKNTDCYSALQVTLTYSFMAKCKVCHNEDE